MITDISKQNINAAFAHCSTDLMDLKNGALQWCQKRNEHIAEALDLNERLLRSEMLTIEEGRLLCSLRLIDEGGRIHGCSVVPSDDVLYGIVLDSTEEWHDDDQKPPEDHRILFYTPDVVLGPWIANPNAIETVEAYSLAFDELSSDQLATTSFLADLFASASADGSIPEALLTNGLASSVTTVKNLAQEISSTPMNSRLSSLLSVFQSMMTDVSGVTDVNSDSDVGYTFDVTDYKYTRTKDILQGVWTVISTVVKAVASIAMIVGGVIAKTVGAVVLGVCTVIDAVTSKVSAQTNWQYGQGSTKLYARAIQMDIPLLSTAIPQSVLPLSQKRISLPWGLIEQQAVLPGDNRIRLLIYASCEEAAVSPVGSIWCVQDYGVDTYGTIYNQPYHNFWCETDQEAYSNNVNYLTRLMTNFAEYTRPDWFGDYVPLLQQWRPQSEQSPFPTTSKQKQVILNIIKNFCCIACWMVFHSLDKQYAHGAPYTFKQFIGHDEFPEDPYPWAGSWQTYQGDEYMWCLSSGYHGVSMQSTFLDPEHTWFSVYNDDTMLLHLDQLIGEPGQIMEENSQTCWFGNILASYFHDFMAYQGATVTYGETLGALEKFCIRQAFSRIVAGEPSIWALTGDDPTDWSSYTLSTFDPFSVGDEDPDIITDPWLTPPNVQKRSVIMATVLAITLAAVVVTTTIIVKRKVRTALRNRTLKREQEAIQAQEAFAADPNNKTLAKKYQKAQRRFSRAAKRTGYSSNNVGTFSTASIGNMRVLSDKLSTLFPDEEGLASTDMILYAAITGSTGPNLPE